MLSRETITERVADYLRTCAEQGSRPTYNGFSLALGCSDQTIWNVAHGVYNGKRYGEIPAPSRFIANDDFDLIRGVFGLVSDVYM